MIVYAERARTLSTTAAIRATLAAVRAAHRVADEDSVTTALIETGMLESGVLDALCPQSDDVSELAARLRDASDAAARAFCHLKRDQGDVARLELRRAQRRLDALQSADLPARVHLSTPEGFAYYALYPESYRRAAMRVSAAAPVHPCFQIGIRSIGTSLSALVSAELSLRGHAVSSLTVRPRGHPFDRTLDISAALARTLSEHREWLFLVVDEGPGLSGSSFGAVCQLLRDIGVADSNIIVLCSWEPDGASLRAPSGRTAWARHRRVYVPFEDVEPAVLRERRAHAPLRELSAGAWRTAAYAAAAHDAPAVQPQHERRKYLDTRARVRLKFAGLGSAGGQRLARAHTLADAGVAARVDGVRNGFLIEPYCEGTPLAPGDAEARLLDAAARHAAVLRDQLPTAAAADTASLLEMIEVNARELGVSLPRNRIERATRSAADQPAVAVDARMQPHEWLRTGETLLKTDSLDHHDDHFLPGCTDICWDLAGTIVEFGLDPAAERALIERFNRYSAQDGDALRRLPFYRVAYSAFRAGYTALAIENLRDSPDGRAFARLAPLYTARLHSELSRL